MSSDVAWRIGTAFRASVRGRSGLLAALLAVAVLAIGALSVHRYVSLDRELTEAALARRAAIGSLAATTLSDKFDRLVDVGIALATRVRFQELVGAGRWVEAIQILRRVPEDFEFIDRLFITDDHGTLRADAPELPGVVGTNFAHRDWFKGVSRDWKPYVSQLYRRTAVPRRNLIAVSVPIRTADARVAGILVIQVKLDAFFDWARRIDLGPESRVLAVDSAWRAGFDSKAPAGEEGKDPAADPFVQRLAPSESAVRIVREKPGGEDLVVGYAPAAHGWGVVTIQPAQAAFAARDALLRQMLLDGVLIAFLAVAGIVLGAMVLLQKRREEADRTHREELETVNRQLRESEERLNFALQKSHIGGWDLDLVDHSAYRTLEHDRIFGYDSLLPQWTYEMFLEHVLPEDRAEVDRCFRAATAAQTEWNFECRIRRVDGEVRWIWATGEHQRNEAGQARVMAGIVQDITERKRAEQEIRDLNTSLERRVAERTQQLEASNKELESFSYSVSHDLRAPLRAVDGFSLMLEEDHAARLDDEGRRLLGVIRESAAHMGGLIDDLLEFSQVGRKALAPTLVDMRSLAGEVAAEIGPACPKARIDLGKLPMAAGDRGLLRHVWTNLIGNALKYSARVASPRVEISGYLDGAESVYQVKDNGAGFDMRYYEKLFGVFQRLHREEEFEGTGVGLAIVQRVILRHGGRVWGEGAPGQGACFRFSLPKGG